MTFGERVKQRRKELGMTQLELAKAIGYDSKTTMCQIESGVRNANQSKIAAIARVLGVTPSYFFEDSVSYDVELYGCIEKMDDGQRARLLEYAKLLTK